LNRPRIILTVKVSVITIKVIVLSQGVTCPGIGVGAVTGAGSEVGEVLGVDAGAGARAGEVACAGMF
jgi:hypothetical protein